MTSQEMKEIGLTDAEIATYKDRIYSQVINNEIKKLSARQWELINSFFPELELVDVINMSHAEIKELCYTAINGKRI